MPIDKKHLDRMVSGDDSAKVHKFCVACGYDLTGAVSDRCPECGTFWVRAEWQRESDAIGTRVGNLEDAVGWVPFALKVGLIGIACRLAGLLFGVDSFPIWLGRVAAVLCGLATFFLGLGQFRYRQLPAWAVDRLKVQPKPELAMVAVVLGFVLVVSAVASPW